MPPKSLSAELASIVGAENASVEPADLLPYIGDSYSQLMKRDVPLPDAVVLPADTAEVQAVVRLAAARGLAVYPRSFGANIAAAAIPYRGGLVIDLKRMDHIVEIDEETMTATVEPGVSWAQLRKAAEARGLDTMPIIGPYHVGPVGNFLLTNITAYSTRHMTDRAVTLEAVLPDGEILRTGSQALANGDELNPYFRAAYGPDLTGLFRGSLGNFGLITRLVLRLRPLHEAESVLFLRFTDVETAIGALKRIERQEFSRFNFLANDRFWLHVLLPPDRIRQAEERTRVLAGLGPFVMAVGLGGSPDRVALYRRLALEAAAEFGGAEQGFDGEFAEAAVEVAEGSSQKIIRMFGPFGGFVPIIACVPPRRVAELTAIGEALVDEYGLTDPLSGERLKPQVIIVPYDRASTVYVEQEFLFDPNDEAAVLRATACLRDGYGRAAATGGVHTIPNRSLLKRLNPGYVKLLKGLKATVDPDGTFLPGPYSLQ